MKPPCPGDRIVGTEGLIRHAPSALRVDLANDVDDSIVVRDVQSRGAHWIRRATRRQCDAPRHVWVSPLHEVFNVAKLLDERARRRQRFGAYTGDAGQRACNRGFEALRRQLSHDGVVIVNELARGANGIGRDESGLATVRANPTSP